MSDGTWPLLLPPVPFNPRVEWRLIRVMAPHLQYLQHSGYNLVLQLYDDCKTGSQPKGVPEGIAQRNSRRVRPYFTIYVLSRRHKNIIPFLTIIY